MSFKRTFGWMSVCLLCFGLLVHVPARADDDDHDDDDDVVVGPPGPQGPQGKQGDPGPTGADGATGPPGVVSFPLGNTRGGTDALFSNTIGAANTAFGVEPLRNNVYGSYNTASGFRALYSNTQGSYNTANGSRALQSNTYYGSYNTASGSQALLANSTGNSNTASGARALYSNTTGSNNIGIGYRGGFYLTGSDNIAIGNTGVAAESGVIRIGTAQSKTYVAGINGVAVVGSAVLVDGNGQLGTLVSSRRFKEDIRDMGDATDRLLQLRAVLFRYKQEAAKDDRPVQYGLIAEEVAEIFPELVVFDEEGKPLTVRYHILSSMLLNELQKQHEWDEAQARELAELRAQVHELRTLEARLEAIESRASPVVLSDSR